MRIRVKQFDQVYEAILGPDGSSAAAELGSAADEPPRGLPPAIDSGLATRADHVDSDDELAVVQIPPTPVAMRSRIRSDRPDIGKAGSRGLSRAMTLARRVALRFPNRVGIAAGFDKNGVCIDGLAAIGLASSK